MFKNSFLVFIFHIILIISFASAAHVDKPAQAKLALLDNGEFKITLKTDILHLLNIQIPDDDINEKRLIEQLRRMPMADLLKLLSRINNTLKNDINIRFDDISVPISNLSGPTLNDVKSLINTPVGDEGYSVEYIGYGFTPDEIYNISLQFPVSIGNVIVEISQPVQIFIPPGQKSSPITLNLTDATPHYLITQIITAFDYIHQGFIHIIPKGLDHILFIFALFLFTTKFSTLLWQVSAFTLAHTLTLALGLFGLVTLPSNIVEPLIALSIVFIAIENIYFSQLKKSRILVIFLFGLLHGLGFASVLLSLGLAPNQVITSLIAFNIGVEIGQISILLIALACFYKLQKMPKYQSHIVKPLNIIIALIGFYWFVERII